MEVLGCELANDAKKELMLDSSPANASHDITIRTEQSGVSTSIDPNGRRLRSVSKAARAAHKYISSLLMVMALGDT